MKGLKLYPGQPIMKVKLISGEIIVGKIVQENNLKYYILTKQPEFDEDAIALYGKEFCDMMASEPCIIDIFKDEIVNMELD